MIHSTVFEDDVTDLLRATMADTETLLLVNPSRAVIESLVTVLGEQMSTVRLLVDEDPLKDLADDFLVASTLADRIDDGLLAVRTLETVPRHSLLLTEDSVVSLVEGGGQVAGLPADDDSFVRRTYDHYDRAWDAAPEYTLRTPPLSEIRQTLEADIGPAAVEDFDVMLEALDSARRNGEGLDEVTISLLVAAKNDELLYDISRWGEDIGLASKATFSRTKNQLEDHDIIATEKVPIDVGRPRLRLMLGSAVDDASTDAVVEQAESTLG